MRLAASDTADTGATTLLMKMELDRKIRQMTAAITPQTTSTVRDTWRSSSPMPVT